MVIVTDWEYQRTRLFAAFGGLLYTLTGRLCTNSLALLLPVYPGTHKLYNNIRNRTNYH